MFIVITGPSASGKSAFAARLARDLGTPLFTKDNIKIALSEHILLDDPVKARQVLSRATSNVMFSVADSMLAAGMPFILEANFRQYECDRINAMISSYGCKCLTYLFAGDLHALARRFIERERTAERHTSLKIPDFLPVQDVYAKQFEEFVNVTVNSDRIYVDATNFESIDFENLVESARSFML